MSRAQQFSKIACIGEVMIELILGEGASAELNVAGDSYNTAVYLAKLAPEVSVDYVTVLGTDKFSDRIIDHMNNHGVGTRSVTRHQKRMPGLYAIDTDPNGERSFSYWRSASAAKTLFEEDGRNPEVLLAAYDLVLLTGISIAILGQKQRDRVFSGLDTFREKGGLVAFDSNYRAHLWNDPDLARNQTEEMWRRTDIALPSVDDEMALFGEANEADVLHRLKEYGVRAGALKCGPDGPIDLGPCGVRANVARATSVVDTTAAGDSFNAGYLAALAKGEGPENAMLAGHSVAVQVIAKRGAIVNLD